MKKLIVSTKTIRICAISFSIFLFCWVLCNSIFQNGDLGICNFICMLISFVTTFIAIHEIVSNGLKIYSIFSFVFFGALLFNTLTLSGKQTEKSILDLYYYFVGGYTLLFWLSISEKINFNIHIKSLKMRQTTIFYTIFIVYICLSILRFSRNGIPVFGENLSVQGLRLYVESGLSGICYILSYVTVILASDLNNKKRFISYVIVILIEGVLGFSRGNIARILILYILTFLYNYKDAIIFKKKFNFKIVLIIILFFLCFSIMGNLRTMIRGDKTLSLNSYYWINEHVDTNINLGFFAWIYGYSSINFDALKMLYSQNPSYSMATLLAPFKRLVMGARVYEEYLAIQEIDFYRIYVPFSKGAMVTFIAPYIKDLGGLFFFEINFVGLIYAIIIAIAKIKKFLGLYSYISLLVVLSVCGNYLFSFSYLYVLFFSVILLIIMETADGK